jgi:rubredoxin
MVALAMELLKKKVADAQTIEAEPVRHGRWVKTEDVYRCTNCGTTNHVKEVMGKPDYNYCPECGADMRGRNNNGICEKS